MAVRGLLDRLKNGFIDPENHASGKGEERQVSEHANQAEIGQRQEHA